MQFEEVRCTATVLLHARPCFSMAGGVWWGSDVSELQEKTVGLFISDVLYIPKMKEVVLFLLVAMVELTQAKKRTSPDWGDLGIPSTTSAG